MNDHRPSDEELNAYIDGELSPDDRARVAQAVAGNPDLADRVAALAQLKSTVAGLADKPGMTLEDLDLADPAPKRTRLRIAASIVAVEAFIAAHPDFPGAIEISGTVDEESGGFGGVAHLAKKGYFSKPRVDHVIIPEPLNKDRVCLGHRISHQPDVPG